MSDRLGHFFCSWSKNPRQKVLEYAGIQKHWMTRSADRITLCKHSMKYCQSTQKLPTSQFSMGSGYWSLKITNHLDAIAIWESSLAGYFKQKIDKTFEGMTGVTAIVDNILVFGKTIKSCVKSWHMLMNEVSSWIRINWKSELPNSRADDWPKVLSLRTLLVRSVQHLVTYIKMFVCMSSFRIRLMTSSLMSTNRVTALEPYIPIITDY